MQYHTYIIRSFRWTSCENASKSPPTHYPSSASSKRAPIKSKYKQFLIRNFPLEAPPHHNDDAEAKEAALFARARARVELNRYANRIKRLKARAARANSMIPLIKQNCGKTSVPLDKFKLNSLLLSLPLSFSLSLTLQPSLLYPPRWHFFCSLRFCLSLIPVTVDFPAAVLFGLQRERVFRAGLLLLVQRSRAVFFFLALPLDRKILGIDCARFRGTAYLRVENYIDCAVTRCFLTASWYFSWLSELIWGNSKFSRNLGIMGHDNI